MTDKRKPKPAPQDAVLEDRQGGDRDPAAKPAGPDDHAGMLGEGGDRAAPSREGGMGGEG